MLYTLTSEWKVSQKKGLSQDDDLGLLKCTMWHNFISLLVVTKLVLHESCTIDRL